MITKDEYGWGEVLFLEIERNNVGLFGKGRDERSEIKRDSLIYKFSGGSKGGGRWGGDWIPEYRWTD